jgi:hypothetical protein
MKYLITSITTALVVILVIGCTKAPKEEIDKASKTISEAKDVDAMRYAPQELEASENSFDKAMSEIQGQDKKLWGKNYKQASSLLSDAVVSAKDAIKKTAELKARTTEEATKAEAETAVNRVYAAYKESKKSGKNAKLLAEVIDLLKETQSAMKEGNYKGAVEAARQADVKIIALRTAILKLI